MTSETDFSIAVDKLFDRTGFLWSIRGEGIFFDKVKAAELLSSLESLSLPSTDKTARSVTSLIGVVPILEGYVANQERLGADVEALKELARRVNRQIIRILSPGLEDVIYIGMR